MNQGACKLQSQFISPELVSQITSRIDDSLWTKTLAEDMYANESWRVLKLVDESEPTELLSQFPEVETLLKFFKCRLINVVLYSLCPGGIIHPHRDMSGTLEFGRLRFHVPLTTNDQVNFSISKKDTQMKPGELWALNTSYLHSVKNLGDSDRVHLVIMVEANDWCWQQLPAKNIHYYLHYIFYIWLIGIQAVKSLVYEPHKLRGRLRLARLMFKLLLQKHSTKKPT